MLGLMFIATMGIAAQYRPVKSRPVDVHMGQRVVAVVDSNNQTVTVIPQPDMWVCASTDKGKSCKSSYDVSQWLIANADNGHE